MADKKPTIEKMKQEMSEWRDHQLYVVETLKELKNDTARILEKLSEHEREITHLKWRSGIISIIAGALSGFSTKFTDLFH